MRLQTETMDKDALVEALADGLSEALGEGLSVALGVGTCSDPASLASDQFLSAPYSCFLTPLLT